MGRVPESKKGFMVYKGYYILVRHLSDEAAGRLFKALLAHSNAEEPDVAEDIAAEYEFMRAQIDDDAERYERRREQNRKNGLLGGRPAIAKVIDEEPAEAEVGKKPEKKKRTSAKDYTDEFEQLWEVYPNRSDKWAGFLKYQARRKKYPHEALLAAVRAYTAQLRQTGKTEYTKQLKTFFSNDNADFVRWIGSQPPAGEQQADTGEDWAEYFRRGEVEDG